ncbi:MAG: linear amide C-N hydrolase [Sedimentisphaerales bacterium]
MFRKIHTLYAVIFIAAFLLVSQISFACSSFCLNQGTDNIVLAKSFAFMAGDGMAIVNKRNVSKTALISPPDTPAKWVSKYGSITFNQIGREMPYGGINEAGLVVEEMWLNSAIYPATDARDAVTELQWIQYQLDNCATVDEVIATDKKIRIAQEHSKIHYMVCDKAGSVATIDFINGKMVSTKNGSLVAPVLTNSTYGESAQYLAQYNGFGGTKPLAISSSSLDRFTRLCYFLKYDNSKNTANPVTYAMDMLASVTQQGWQWSMVYDVKNLKVTFYTREFGRDRTICLADFDFSCESPTLVMNINRQVAPNTKDEFIPYTAQLNKDLIVGVFKRTDFLQNVPDVLLEQLANYPDSFSCSGN